MAPVEEEAFRSERAGALELESVSAISLFERDANGRVGWVVLPLVVGRCSDD